MDNKRLQSFNISHLPGISIISSFYFPPWISKVPSMQILRLAPEQQGQLVHQPISGLTPQWRSCRRAIFSSAQLVICPAQRSKLILGSKMNSLSQYALMTWLLRGFTETQSLSTPPPRSNNSGKCNLPFKGRKQARPGLYGGGFTDV